MKASSDLSSLDSLSSCVTPQEKRITHLIRLVKKSPIRKASLNFQPSVIPLREAPLPTTASPFLLLFRPPWLLCKSDSYSGCNLTDLLRFQMNQIFLRMQIATKAVTRMAMIRIQIQPLDELSMVSTEDEFGRAAQSSWYCLPSIGVSCTPATYSLLPSQLQLPS